MNAKPLLVRGFSTGFLYEQDCKPIQALHSKPLYNNCWHSLVYIRELYGLESAGLAVIAFCGLWREQVLCFCTILVKQSPIVTLCIYQSVSCLKMLYIYFRSVPSLFLKQVRTSAVNLL